MLMATVLTINDDDEVTVKFIRESESFDGHSLRAYNYWKEDMKDIPQVEDGTQCYEFNGQAYKESDLIIYKGETLTAKELYEKVCD